MKYRTGVLLGLGVAGWTSLAFAQVTPPKWVSWDGATKTVTFELVAGAPGKSGPFNFNGYTAGAATLVIPAKSAVVMNFQNADGNPHSAVIIGDKGPLPNMGHNAAIPRAYTRDLTPGIPQGGTDILRFTAPASGTFRIICGVPGHALSGQWIFLKIDPSAKAPSWIAP